MLQHPFCAGFDGFVNGVITPRYDGSSGQNCPSAKEYDVRDVWKVPYASAVLEEHVVVDLSPAVELRRGEGQCT